MSEFLIPDAIDEDYSIGDTPPEVDGSARRIPRPPVAEPRDTDDPDDDATPLDPDFIAEPRQTPRSKKYQRKAQASLLVLAKRLAARPNTVADSAAVIHAGPDLSRAFGDAADTNATVRKMVDFVTEGTTSPTIALVSAVGTLALQIARNHEQTLKPKERRIRLRGREIPLRRMGIEMGPFADLVSNDPEILTAFVFDNPEMAQNFSKWVIAR